MISILNNRICNFLEHSESKMFQVIRRFISRPLNHTLKYIFPFATIIVIVKKPTSIHSEYWKIIHPDTFCNNKKAISPYLFAFYDEFFSIDCGFFTGNKIEKAQMTKEKRKSSLCMLGVAICGETIKRPRDLFPNTCDRRNVCIPAEK